MAASLAFDSEYYLTQNPDVLQYLLTVPAEQRTFNSAAEHYIKYGAAEGRDPNSFFDTSYYFAANPDVLVAYQNGLISDPFSHFVFYGAAEGRNPNPSWGGVNVAANFDAETYLAANPDVAAAIDAGVLENAYQHYVLYGQFEGRPGAQLDNGGSIPGGGGGNVGTTFTLTTAIDNINGTAANDTIIGTVSFGFPLGSGTFNTGDAIDGGGGVDTLSLIANSPDTVVAGKLSNVEIVEIQDLSGGATIDLSNATGVQTLSSVRSSGSNTIFNNVKASAAVSLSSTGVGGAAVTVNYANAVIAGLTDKQAVSLNNATGAVTVEGIEQFDVTATGTNTIDLNSTTIQTINVSGAGDVGFGLLDATVKTFNGSASTGDLTADFTATNKVTATGGAGDDTFTFGGTLTTGDTVDGGAGFDTVSITNTDVSLAADVAAINALKNVERVEFAGASATVNEATLTNAAVTNLLFTTAGADIVNNAGARTYEFGVGNGGDATFNLNATSTTLNIDLKGTNGGVAADDGVDADVGNLIINLSATQPTTAVATVNLTSEGDLADAVFNNVGTVTASAGSTFKIDGSGNLDIAGFTNKAIVDASALTGDLVIEGSEASGASVAPTGQTGADTITLGAGQDVVQFSSGLDSGVANSAVAGSLFFDVITGFQAGANGDVLEASGTAVYNDLSAAGQAAINALSGAGATFQAAADIAAAEAGADQWTAFTFQGQTYAVYDGGADSATYVAGEDIFVQITGVTVANLTADNFA